MTNSTLALSPLSNNLDAAMQNLPTPLNRRHLLSRSAAIGAASQVGLLGSALLGSSLAQARTTLQYETVQAESNVRYQFDGSVWECMVRRYGLSNGESLTYCLTRPYNRDKFWTGTKIYPADGSAQWIRDVYVPYWAVTFDTIRTDLNVDRWDNSRRRLSVVVPFLIPNGATRIRYHKMPEAYATADAFSGVSYLLGNIWYTQFTTSFFKDGNWYNMPIVTCSGEERTKLLLLADAAIEKGVAFYAANGAAKVGICVAAAGVLSGGVSTGWLRKNDVAAWAIATGAATAIGAGITVGATYVVTQAALITALASVITKAEELYSAFMTTIAR